jgi:hypothetical protein
MVNELLKEVVEVPFSQKIAKFSFGTRQETVRKSSKKAKKCRYKDSNSNSK